MEALTHVFTIYSIIFLLWMCFKWSTKTFVDSMIKVSLFILSLIGIVIEFKVLNII